jgi:hypothetical protein
MNVETHTTNYMYGAKTLLTAVLIGFAKWIGTLNNVHLPPIIIELLMCLSYAGGITIAGITVYKFYTDKKKNGKRKG